MLRLLLINSLWLLITAGHSAEWRFSLPLPEGVPAGTGLDAEDHFSLWLPDAHQDSTFVGIILACDYQTGGRIYDDPQWRQFASERSLALLRHRIYRPSGSNPDRRGPGSTPDAVSALLAGIGEAAQRSQHPELASAPFVHSGLSWSGHQAIDLAMQTAERTLAVIAFQQLSSFQNSEATGPLDFPLLWTAAEFDQFYTSLSSLARFQGFRRAGAPWTFLYRQGLEHHEIGDNASLLTWLGQAIDLRLPASPDQGLRPLPEAAWLGVLRMDLRAERAESDSRAIIAPAHMVLGDPSLTSYLANEAMAQSWQQATDFNPRPVQQIAAHMPGTPAQPASISPLADTANVWQPSHRLINPRSGKPGSLAMAWTSEALLVSARLSDEQLSIDQQQPWRGDSLELFFSTDIRSGLLPGSQSTQIIVAPGGTAILKTIPERNATDPTSADQLTATTVQNDSGWSLEMRIPWAVLGLEHGRAGQRLRFDYSHNDNGKSSETFHWAKDQGGFLIPANWGMIVLANEKPSQP